MVKTLLAVLVLSVPVLAVAEETKKAPEAAKAASQAELKVGTGVESKDVTGAAEDFKIAPDTKLYLGAKVTGMGADGKVTLAFFKGDKEAYKKELTVSGSPYRLHVYKTFRAGDAGEWTAKALGSDGAELAAAKFKVEIEK